MKKIILSMLLLAGATTYAQVGINKETPKATLDISVKDENKDNDHLDGLLIPRVTKEKAFKMANASEKPEESTLIYVNEVTTYSSGADTKVDDITENGYYYWNGAKWVRQAGQNGEEWVYDQTTKQINLRRSGQGNFKNKVNYNEFGAFRSYDFDNYTIFGGQEETLANNFSIDWRKSSSINIVRPDHYYTDLNNKTYKNDIFLADEDVDNSIIVGSRNTIISDKTKATNYDHLIAANYNAIHEGTGNVKYLYGLSTSASIRKGTSNGYITPLRTSVVTGEEVGDIEQMNAVEARTSIASIGNNINKAEGFNSIINILHNASANITNVTGLNIAYNFREGNSVTIENAIGIKYEGFYGRKGKSITNHYGIYLKDIYWGTNNYAIYTNAGNIRFGDLADATVTGDRLVVANTDGVLSTGTTSLSDLESLWANDASSELVRLKNTSKEVARTDANRVTISDAGAITAKGFIGYNGASIFPDYVFEKYYKGYSDIKADYNFHNLASVESFIKKNGHLPGYKSAKEIAKEGLIDISATQLINVEKIEELYLHTIEQEKALKAKDAKIAELEARLERLEKLINK